MMERRRERRTALEVLYQIEVRGASEDEILEARQQVDRRPASEFTLDLVHGVHSHLDEIDPLIDSFADHWSIDRMPIVDKNIIRICVYEMKYMTDIPVGVSINEAVELAKAYGTDDSSKFVNGLVGRIAQEVRQSEGSGSKEEARH